jgi:hypothetical protein
MQKYPHERWEGCERHDGKQIVRHDIPENKALALH